MTTTISDITSIEVLDSRGNPTLETEIYLSDGSYGSSMVPSGASTGKYEARELRDGDPARFRGLGLLNSISDIRSKVFPELKGRSPYDQVSLDHMLRELNGDPNRPTLGSIATLSISLAIAKAASNSKKMPLYSYMSHNILGSDSEYSLPVPMFNILNGGRHATNSTDFQEFMIMPVGFETLRDAVRAGAEIYKSLGKLLESRNLNTNVGDEGGFAPPNQSNTMAIEFVLEATEKAGYEPGKDCFVALDIASSEFFKDGIYHLDQEGLHLTSEELIAYYSKWLANYPIISIEDALSDDDKDGWVKMTKLLGDKIQLVGDDLFATDTKRIVKGVELGTGNAVLIKPNQIGTLTETMDALVATKASGWGTIVSHRSGETEDSTIADISVGWNTGQIKAGAPCRSERLSKYNRLLKIENRLGNTTLYAGWRAFDHVKSLKTSS